MKKNLSKIDVLTKKGFIPLVIEHKPEFPQHPNAIVVKMVDSQKMTLVNSKQLKDHWTSYKYLTNKNFDSENLFQLNLSRIGGCKGLHFYFHCDRAIFYLSLDFSQTCSETLFKCLLV